MKAYLISLICLCFAGLAPMASSQSAGELNTQGADKQAKGDLDGAIADFTQAIQLDPKNAAAYCNRGIARQAKDDLDGAIADFSDAIKLNPKDPSFFKKRGLAKYKKTDLDGAIADYTTALKLNPKDPEAHIFRGVAEQAQPNTNIKAVIADLKLPAAHAVGWIDRIQQASTNTTTGKSTPWVTYFILRCADGHDYWLLTGPDTVAPAAMKSSPSILYQIDGGLEPTPKSELNNLEDLVNTPGDGVKMPEHQDVLHMILARSIKEIK